MAKVPTAPEMAQVAISSRAFTNRAPRAGKFGIIGGQLNAEGGGFGMDAVAAPDGRRHFIFKGAFFERRKQPISIFDQYVGSARQLNIQACIQHIA